MAETATLPEGFASILAERAAEYTPPAETKSGDNLITEAAKTEETSSPVVDKIEESSNSTEAGVEESAGTGEEVSAETTTAEEVGATEEEAVSELAREYGLAPEDVEGIETVDELNRVVAILDRQAQKRLTTKTTSAKTDAQPVVEKVDQVVRQESDKSVKADGADDDELIKTLEKDYDPVIANAIKREREKRLKLEAEVESLKSSKADAERAAKAQAEAQAKESQEARTRNDVNTILQTASVLDQDGTLFGKDGSRTADQTNRLQAFMTAAWYTHVEQIDQRGGEYVPMTPGLAKRAFNASMANTFKKQSQDAKTERVKQQAKQKMGKGETKASVDPKEFTYNGDTTDADSIVKTPAFQKFFANAKRATFS